MKQLLKGLTAVAFVVGSVSAFAATNDELERKVNILADEIAQLKASQHHIGSGAQAFGMGQSASKAYFLNSGLSIGGYGEIKYTNYAKEEEDGDDNVEDSVADTLRNVIYLGYKYNKNWVLNVEIEIEHVDEVFTEFLYLDYLKSDALNYRAGLALIPMGLTNELHEPIYFNSVNRPEVEKYLLPTTWRELGFGAFGKFDKISYKAFLFNGPNANGIGQSSGIRGGRKKGGAGGKTNASTFVAVVRADYELNSNSSFGVSYLTGEASSTKDYDYDTAQNTDLIDMEISILDVHAMVKQGDLYGKFLYTNVKNDNAKTWNEQVDVTSGDGNIIANEMEGFYVELGYDFECIKGALVTPFVRFEKYDLNKVVDEDTFGSKNQSADRTNTTIGVAYKPIEQIVFKTDYTYKHKGNDAGVNELNVGLGYVF